MLDNWLFPRFKFPSRSALRAQEQHGVVLGTGYAGAEDSDLPETGEGGPGHDGRSVIARGSAAGSSDPVLENRMPTPGPNLELVSAELQVPPPAPAGGRQKP